MIGVENRCFGKTVTVAGLLTARDVIEGIRAQGGAGPVFLPRAMFSPPPSVTLDDATPRAMAKEIGRPVYIVDAMSDVVGIMRGEGKTFLPRSRKGR